MTDEYKLRFNWSEDRGDNWQELNAIVNNEEALLLQQLDGSYGLVNYLANVFNLPKEGLYISGLSLVEGKAVDHVRGEDEPL